MLRASFRLAPCSSTTTPCEVPVAKTRDAYDQLLPPEKSTCTRTSCVLDSLRGFHRGEVARSLGLRATRSRNRTLHGARNASADRGETRAAFFCLSRAPPHVWGVSSRAWAFSSHGACSDHASDTSVASPSSATLVEPSPCLPALVSDSLRVVAFAPSFA